MNFFNIHRKTPVLESLFNNIAGLKAPTQIFSSEHCEIFKSVFQTWKKWLRQEQKALHEAKSEETFETGILRF